MKDFNRPLRKAFYELLNGQLTYNTANVPVFDEKVKKSADNNLYVIIGAISSTNAGTFSEWKRDMNITLDVVTKTSDSVSRNMADAISGSILELVMPTVQSNAIVQANFQYINCQLDSDRYLDLQLNPTTSMVRRLLTFSLTAIQND